MIQLLIKKFFYLITALFITLTMTFFLMKSIPGNPLQSKQGSHPVILKAMEEHYGFKKPIYIQYISYLSSVIKGDLGPSFKYRGRSVKEIILSGASKSAILGLQAFCLSLIGGITLGCIGGYFSSKTSQLFFSIITVLFVCTPSFLAAAFLQHFFAIRLYWFPIAQWNGFSSTILPTLALAALPIGFIAKLTKDNIEKTLKTDAILLARSKGLSEKRIFFTHILPIAISPVVAYLGFDVATILTGSFVIEKIFAIPGMNSTFVNALISRDYTVIMGNTIFYTSLFLTAVFISDCLLLFLNPQLRRSAYVD